MGGEPLAFAPWGATTGAGSLPHRSVGDALALIAATCLEVPHRPQLPALDPFEMLLLQGTVAGRRPAAGRARPRRLGWRRPCPRPSSTPARRSRRPGRCGGCGDCSTPWPTVRSPVPGRDGRWLPAGPARGRRPARPPRPPDGRRAPRPRPQPRPPACGLALLDPAQAARTARRALDVAAHVRRLVLDDLPALHRPA